MVSLFKCICAIIDQRSSFAQVVKPTSNVHAPYIYLTTGMTCNNAADDAVAFFDRCKAGLEPGGIIVVKENICKHTEFVVDK